MMSRGSKFFRCSAILPGRIAEIFAGNYNRRLNTPPTITTALEALQAGTATARELAEACFGHIKRLNPKLNAFITVLDVESTIQAQPPAAIQPLSSLRGIPIALKDLFDTAGIPTTAGSRFFADHIPETDAFVVEKIKQAGAILMGKTNTHEIALGVTGNNPHYGTARNPW